MMSPIYTCPFFVFLISLSYAVSPAAESISSEIPKDLVPILSAYESETRKAWDLYQAALSKAEERAKKEFGAKMGAVLKKGDLDTANAIRAHLDRITSGELISENEAIWKNKDLLGDRATIPIVGRWGNDGALRWEFMADGTGKHYWGTTVYACKWELKGGEFIVYVEGPSPKRPLRIVDKNTINIEPGNSARMK